MKYRIKSMQEILKENPGAKFDELGNLDVTSGLCIHKERFQLLGKTCDKLLAGVWDESWYEVIEPKEPKKYYKWRLYYKDGDIVEPEQLIDESGDHGMGSSYCSEWDNLVHKEKISEGVIKIEGQEGFEDE